MTISRRQFIGGGVSLGASILTSSPSSITYPTAKPASIIPHSLPEVPPAISRALDALAGHASRIPFRDRIAVADYGLNSGQPRFHIVNVEMGAIEESYLVSHGRGSDPENTGLVQHFSNRPGSNASSSGSFLTANTYVGKHGKSRRLEGLDEENDLAWDRAIVIHGAEYVDGAMAEMQGRVGRSLGCFAFERGKIAEVLERLGPGRLLYSTK